MKAAIHISLCNHQVSVRMCNRFVSPRLHFCVCMNHCGNNCSFLCERMLLLRVGLRIHRNIIQTDMPNLWAGSFPGVAERLKGGSGKTDRGGHCGMFEILMQCCAVCVVKTRSPLLQTTPSQPVFPLLQPYTLQFQSPPHSHFTLTGLCVEPAQSCRFASWCQPNYHMWLNVGKTSS